MKKPWAIACVLFWIAALGCSGSEDADAGFHCLSSWDGSHPEIVQLVRGELRDPDSFQHIETRVTPVSDQGLHSFTMEYRARNGFGGMNVYASTGEYANADVEDADSETAVEECAVLSWVRPDAESPTFTPAGWAWLARVLEGAADEAAAESRGAGEEDPIRPVSAMEVRAQNMCREVIADRRISGAVDEAAASALDPLWFDDTPGSRYTMEFEDTPWARADTDYTIGRWEKDPITDYAIVGPGEVRELHHWEMWASLVAVSPSVPGALTGRARCLLVVDPATEDIWFRAPGRPEGYEGHFWLLRGDPEAFVVMDYVEH